MAQRNALGGEHDPSMVRISPNQFGQGALFPQPKPTDEHRWPRGYSPERMADVEEAVAGPSRDNSNYLAAGRWASGRHVEANVHGLSSSDGRWMQGVPDELPVPEGQRHHMPGSPGAVRNIQRSRMVGRRIAETLARSTMPAELMGEGKAEGYMNTVGAGPMRIIDHPSYYEGKPHQVDIRAPNFAIKSNLEDGGALGTYGSGGSPHGPQMTEIRLDSDSDETTLMHEMGHHRSAIEDSPTSTVKRNLQQGVQGIRPKHHPPAKGAKEEAAADRNVLEHYRTDPRSGEQFDPGTYRAYPEHNIYTRGRGPKAMDTFANNYHKALPELDEAHRARADRLAAEGRAQAHSQMLGGGRRLFARDATAPARGDQPLPTEVERDYGQWGSVDQDTWESIGTIKVGAGVPPQELRGLDVSQKTARGWNR